MLPLLLNRNTKVRSNIDLTSRDTELQVVNHF